MAMPTSAAPDRQPATTRAQARSRASAAAREKLLAAGTRLIAEQGIEAINTNVIARAAHVGVGTFYAHFEDKHVFHRAVMARGLEVVRSVLAEAHLAASGRPTDEQVRAGVAALVDVAIAWPDLFRATFSSPASSPAAGARGGGSRRGGGIGLSPRPVEQGLRDLQERGEVAPAIDAGLAARAFTEMQIASVSAWLGDPDAPSREALIETLTRLHPALACRQR